MDLNVIHLNNGMVGGWHLVFIVKGKRSLELSSKRDSLS